MATRDLFYVHSKDTERLVEGLRAWLSKTFSGKKVEETSFPSPPTRSRKLDELPRAFGVRQVGEWIQVWADNYFQKELVEHFSREMNSVVLGLNAESVSMSLRLWVFRSGT